MFKKIVLSFLLIFAVTVNVNAAPITIIHQGQGSGSLGSIPLTDVAFTITLRADTANRESFSTSGTTGFSIDADSATILLAGLGTFDFITPTRSVVNNTNHVVVFSRASGLDLFAGPNNPAFSTYDMLSSIGPIAQNYGALHQWTNPQVVTTGGVLVLDNFYSGSFRSPYSIFQATVVPVPSALLLLSSGLVCLLGLMKKFRR